jgi:hypothetical protein
MLHGQAREAKHPVHAAFARRSLAAFLLAVGAVLAFAGNLALWIDRTIYQTDGFVSTTDNVLQNSDVQQTLADRLTNVIVQDGTLQTEVQQQLPERLKFLAVPLTSNLSDVISQVVLRVLQGNRFQDVYQTALRDLHEQVMKVLDNSNAVSVSGNVLVLDVRPILRSVLESLGLPAPENGQVASALNLPPDAGEIAIHNSAVSWSYRIGHYGRQVIALTIIAAVVALLLSVLVAVSRRSATKRVGVALLVVGLVSLLLLVPLRLIVSRTARSPDAAIAVVRILTNQYRVQSLLLMAAGVVLVCCALMVGKGRPSDVGSWLREHIARVRAVGIAAAVLVLLALPTLSTRAQVSILFVLALFLVATWAYTSPARWAVWTRVRTNALLGRGAPARGADTEGWVASRAAPLRIIGAVLAGLALVLYPSLTFGVVVSVGLLLLAWLAAIEWLSKPATHA